MKGRPHELNLSPDFDPLDPAQVSDPKCWITGPAADALKHAMNEKIAVLRHAPRVAHEAGLDLSDAVETDPTTGKLSLRGAKESQP